MLSTQMTSANDGGGPILGVPDVARLLGISEWKVRAWTEAGVIPHWRSGNSIYYHRAEVLDWWENGRRQPRPAAQPAAQPAPGAELSRLIGEDIEFVIVPRRRAERTAR